MLLNSISIINFKNILSVDLHFSPNINCFIGSNGMGKTNFLDAVYLMSFCRSAFNPVDSQLITHGKDFFTIEGVYSGEDGHQENIYCGMKRGTRKHFKRDKKEYKRLSEHIGRIPLVFVSPADAAVVDGGGEQRRKLMDVVISQYDRAYISELSAYNKALQQRNVLLKSDGEPDSSLLDILEEEMGRHGEAVFARRTDFINKLVPVFQEIYNSISANSEEVGLTYTSHCQRGPLTEVIRRDRARDRAVGYSLHGIHRDDLEMTLGGYPLRHEASQGQTKTFVLALKLAQFDFLRRTVTETVPLLLLDDIFDKLDAGRVEKIVDLVSGNRFGQIFITDTNRDHLDKLLSRSHHDYRLFHVENGVIDCQKEAYCHNDENDSRTDSQEDADQDTFNVYDDNSDDLPS